MITLYDLEVADGQRPSPFCWRTKLALAHKGIDYTTVPVGFTEKDKIAFAGSNTVPVICDHGHGDRPVKDSWEIAAYLDEAYPDRPLFKSGQARAFARFVANWADVTLHGALFPLVVADIHARARPADQAYFRESREKRLGTSLEQVQQRARDGGIPAMRATFELLRRQLKVLPFISGDDPGYADYAVAGSLMWVRIICTIPLLEAGDPVLAWQDRMLDLFGGLCRNAKAAA
jgi:glutathione S-transferase